MSLTRRSILRLTTAAFSVTVLPIGRVYAQANNNFLAVSQLLTGRDSLDVETGDKLVVALRKFDPNFDRRLEALNQALHRVRNPRFATISTSPALAQAETGNTAVEIVRAWYLDRVGSDLSNGGVASYKTALMFDPTRDLIAIPGYPLGDTGYWADPPTVR